MTIEQLREYCLSFPGTEEKLPFASLHSGADTLCFYVGPKIFCMTSIDDFSWINLKGDPEFNVELCERYASVVPGVHMNKRHWVTLRLPGDVTDMDICRLIAESYRLVRSGLPRRIRDVLPE